MRFKSCLRIEFRVEEAQLYLASMWEFTKWQVCNYLVNINSKVMVCVCGANIYNDVIWLIGAFIIGMCVCKLVVGA